MSLLQTFSPKLGRDVVVMGELGYWHLLLVDSDPEVAHVDHEPAIELQRAGVMATSWTHAGVMRVHVLRTFKTAATGPLDAVIQRYVEDCRHEAKRKDLRYTSVEVLEFDAASLQRPEDAIRQQNWNRLIPYVKQTGGLSLEPSLNEIAAWLARAGAITMQELHDRARGDRTKEALLKAAAVMGVVAGRWTSDLNERPLSPATRFMAHPGSEPGAAPAPRPRSTSNDADIEDVNWRDVPPSVAPAEPTLPPTDGEDAGRVADTPNPVQMVLHRVVYAPAQNISVRTMPDYWRDMSHWPPFDEKVLRHQPEDVRARFTALKEAIETYIENGCLCSSAAQAKVSPPTLLRLFRKCLRAQLGTVRIWGWAALIEERGGGYVRHGQTTPTPPGRGVSGTFETFLCRQPTVLDALIKAIEAKFDPEDMSVVYQNAHGVYRKFREACVAAGFTPDDYPLNTPSAGLRSVRRFIKEYLDGHLGCYGYWYGQGAEDKLRVGAGKRLLNLATQPYDLVMMDAHRVDAVGTIWVDTADGPTALAVQRVWLVLLYCAVTGAVLGYSLSYEEQVSAETIERAFVSALTPWRPRVLSDGLSYHKGAGLPNGAVAGIDGFPVVILQMDNAVTHYGNAVREKGRANFGYGAKYGPIRQWFTNARLERYFRTLENGGIHVLPSSTGIGPMDPLAAEDPARAAVEHDVTARYIEDLIEVLLTGENARPSYTRSDMSPLQIMRNLLHRREWLPRCAPPQNSLAPRMGWEESLRPIAGGRTRRPYFELYGRRYSSTAVVKGMDLVGQKVAVWIRHSDSFVEASFLNGQPLHGLFLTGHKPAAPIPLYLLKQVNQSKNRTYVPEEVTAEQIIQDIRDRAAADVQERPYAMSVAGTQLAHLQLLGHATAAMTKGQPASAPAPTFEDVPDFEDAEACDVATVADVAVKPRAAPAAAPRGAAARAPAPAAASQTVHLLPGQAQIDFSKLRSASR